MGRIFVENESNELGRLQENIRTELNRGDVRCWIQVWDKNKNQDTKYKRKATKRDIKSLIRSSKRTARKSKRIIQDMKTELNKEEYINSTVDLPINREKLPKFIYDNIHIDKNKIDEEIFFNDHMIDSYVLRLYVSTEGEIMDVCIGCIVKTEVEYTDAERDVNRNKVPVET